MIESLKGTEVGTTLRFATLASSCESNPAVKPGREYYIAGALNKEGLFAGAWKQRDLEVSERCAIAKCRGKEDCGCDWLKRGGELVALCEDHAWSYLVKAGKSTKLCRGINARGGPEEYACEEFSGNVTEFARCKNKEPKR
ncbi:MAG: hypothetical protein EOP11_14675 [Proteobacteria bacterium]|nr:MAG: hypothetical protein EOP11_14675 [Pseudomonadota bacterium]